jgi:hypothetical protein
VSKRSGIYPYPAVDTAGPNVVSKTGGVLLTETIRAVGLDNQLSSALATTERAPRPGEDRAGPGGDTRVGR